MKQLTSLWRLHLSKFRSRARLLHGAFTLLQKSPLTCSTENLITADAIALNEIFQSSAVNAAWRQFVEDTAEVQFPEGAGGVNPGDRRAIFSLILGLRPKRVLEVGTHIGASTLCVTAALRVLSLECSRLTSLTTVDIVDVNNPVTGPWRQHGLIHSPIDILRKFQLEGLADFVNAPSQSFLLDCTENYDLIFLDGHHAASAVYEEVPLALKCLNPGGVLLLHDYFPHAKPLWRNGYVVPGPYLAIKRHIQNGSDLHVTPLGALPWATKLDSNSTSLAILTRPPQKVPRQD